MQDKQERLIQNLDRIIMWTDNCDQKASYLLTLVGVIATLFCTSQIDYKIQDVIINPFISYWKDGVGEFCLLRFIIVFFICIGVIGLLLAFIYLLLCLRARTNLKDYKESGIIEESRIYFRSIASMTYEDFCVEKANFENDLQSQVYINSKICSLKFEYYNIALFFTFLSIITLVLSFVLFLFV